MLTPTPSPLPAQAWHLSGDYYSRKKGDKPWISEMYGYVFGAAKLGIRHRWDEQSMIYPGYRPTGEEMGRGGGGSGEQRKRGPQAAARLGLGSRSSGRRVRGCRPSLASLTQPRNPSRPAAGVPRILHYGLLWHLEHQHGKWSFDKHWCARPRLPGAGRAAPATDRGRSAAGAAWGAQHPAAGPTFAPHLPPRPQVP
jgi:hypothetical protein